MKIIDKAYMQDYYNEDINVLHKRDTKGKRFLKRQLSHARRRVIRDVARRELER